MSGAVGQSTHSRRSSVEHIGTVSRDAAPTYHCGRWQGPPLAATNKRIQP
jgi:hypothetical protein